MAFRAGDALALCAIGGAAVLGMGVQRGLQASYDDFDMNDLVHELEAEIEREFGANGHDIRIDLKNLNGLHELQALSELRGLEGLKDIKGMERLEALEALEGLEGLEALEALEGLEELDFDFNFNFDVDGEFDFDGLNIDLSGLTVTLESLGEQLEQLEDAEWSSDAGLIELHEDRDQKKKRRIIVRRPGRNRRGGDGN